MALLVLDNAPGCLQDLSLVHSNIQFEYLSNTTNSLLQLFKQEIITTFKSYYTSCTFCGISDASEKETFVSIIKCWKSYSIADYKVNIRKSMTRNGCWKKLWPETFNDSQGFPTQQLNKIKNILMLASKIPGEGIPDFKGADMKEILDSYTAELTEEDLEQLTVFSETEGEDSDAVVERPQLTASDLKDGLQMVTDLTVLVLKVDHFMDKCLNFKHKVGAVMAL
jgi:hypothetical protein